MPATTITINRTQRDGLYELVRNHLGSVGDLYDALERDKDFAKAARLGLEFSEDFKLLEDIGWGEDEGRDSFELTTPAHDLMEVLERLHGEAGIVLSGEQESAEDVETDRRFQRGYDVCEKVLAELDPRAGDRA
ncbi:MAG TPA: hypothetical protein VFG58_08710 [Solirubrobacterales bacterium]|nr:hypothetical protein [Solirubrobacterales bacterium]